MSVFSDQIDLAVLHHAVTHYAADLPDDLSAALLQGVKAVEQQKPHAILELAHQLQQTPVLDQLYEQALRDLRQNYSAQERAKSLVIQANHPLTGEIEASAMRVAKAVVQTLEQVMEQKRSIALGSAQLQILQALNRYPLSVTDLAPTIGQPPAITHALIQTLWSKGYLDYLGTALPYTVFPFLRDRQYRSQPVVPDKFLTLTSKGYFRLYPIFHKTEVPAIA